jgi:hypothetical protein
MDLTRGINTIAALYALRLGEYGMLKSRSDMHPWAEKGWHVEDRLGPEGCCMLTRSVFWVVLHATAKVEIVSVTSHSTNS